MSVGICGDRNFEFQNGGILCCFTRLCIGADTDVLQCGMLCCSAHSRIACEKSPIEGTRYRTLPPIPAISSAIRSAVKVLPVPHAIISLPRPAVFEAVDNLVKRSSLWCVPYAECFLLIVEEFRLFQLLKSGHFNGSAGKVGGTLMRWHEGCNPSSFLRRRSHSNHGRCQRTYPSRKWVRDCRVRDECIKVCTLKSAHFPHSICTG